MSYLHAPNEHLAPTLSHLPLVGLHFLVCTGGNQTVVVPYGLATGSSSIAAFVQGVGFPLALLEEVDGYEAYHASPQELECTALPSKSHN